MKLIVGLGNPGSKYEDTRHNVGFRAVEKFAADRGIRLDSKKWSALYGQGDAGGEKAGFAASFTVNRKEFGINWNNVLDSGPLLGDEVRVPFAVEDGSIDLVRLRGTFNQPLEEAQRRALVADVMRMLRPGGEVLIHGLAADRPLVGGFPRLPGPAALVGALNGIRQDNV